MGLKLEWTLYIYFVCSGLAGYLNIPPICCCFIKLFIQLEFDLRVFDGGFCLYGVHAVLQEDDLGRLGQVGNRAQGKAYSCTWEINTYE